jgi:hypothetical protein
MTSIALMVTLSPGDYDAVLFDLDGVLTKTASVHAGWQPSSKRAGSRCHRAPPTILPARKRCTRWVT